MILRFAKEQEAEWKDVAALQHDTEHSSSRPERMMHYLLYSSHGIFSTLRRL